MLHILHASAAKARPTYHVAVVQETVLVCQECFITINIKILIFKKGEDENAISFNEGYAG